MEPRAAQEGEAQPQPSGFESGEFADLVAPYRAELHAHCYRMLGSPHDADDALQETLVRAWRGMDRFERRSSLRSWLYTIATNTCLTEIARRRKRVLPTDHLPAADPHDAPGAPIVEAIWIEPYPDGQTELRDGLAAPEARYEQRESIELAFIAALQHLAPNQRAALILRDVLGFSAGESASMLSTTVSSVNSALQRARAAVEKRVPDQSQQLTLRALGDSGLRRLVARYVDAWETCDVDGFAAMLAEDATFAMPPLATWYSGRQGIATWAAGHPLSGSWRWRTVLTSANAQPALAFYAWEEQARAYLPFALNVLGLSGELVSDVTAFIVRSTDAQDPEAYVRFPEQPIDERRHNAGFARFGLPERLD